MKSFDNVELEKQIKVINCGFEEFADHGLKRSSLNRILSNAEVSKGFFYHYFRNKEEFYHYVIEYAIQVVINKLNRENLLEERDYLHRLQLAALYKIEVAKMFPRMFDFLATYYKTIGADEYLKLATRLSGDLTRRILTENIDYSLFKDDQPLEVAMKVTNKYIAQVSTEIGNHINEWSVDKIMHYYNSELEDLKAVVYKKGDTNE